MKSGRKVMKSRKVAVYGYYETEVGSSGFLVRISLFLGRSTLQK